MQRDQHYFVYMVQSSSRRALYIGVTRNLRRRVWEHRTGMIEGFTADYRAHRLVYFEAFTDIRAAILREKQLKGWTRAKKEWLVTKMNPEWQDLSEDLFENTRSLRLRSGQALRLGPHVRIAQQRRDSRNARSSLRMTMVKGSNGPKKIAGPFGPAI